MTSDSQDIKNEWEASGKPEPPIRHRPTGQAVGGDPLRHGGESGPPQSSFPDPIPQMVKPSVVPLKPTWVNSRNVPNRSTFGF